MSEFGPHPAQAKVLAMPQLPEPSNAGELRSVLGLLDYYGCCVPTFSRIVRPLNKVLGKEVVWSWLEKQAEAFRALKREICTKGRALRPL